MRGEGVWDRVSLASFRTPRLKNNARRRRFREKLGEQIRERKTNRRVPSVYHGLSGTKRERLISNGFLHCDMVHEFIENRTRISLKSLAIPAGFEPATHGVEIRYSYLGQAPFAIDEFIIPQIVARLLARSITASSSV
jgi:hypothetical protein